MEPATVAITLRTFAMLREQRGAGSERLEVPAGTTVGRLYRDLFPPGPEGALPVGFAVNRELVPADHVLADGDEVAFLPPVGGG